ncbi:MAG: hypothetical protein ACRDGL_10315, partial [Candidatus Limnocylindrales bacterium]
LATDLDLDDVVGKRIIATRLVSSVTVREENAIAALEVMSRFAADPRWLVYLPPTMAPTATTGRPGLLEHPDEAFAAYARDGVAQVVCEEKHMGSRAVVVVRRDRAVAERRLAVAGAAAGAVLTRTGRPFLTAPGDEDALLPKVRAGLTAAWVWEALASDWVILDCELLPWSAKAGELLRCQYAAVGAASTATLDAEAAVLTATAGRGVDVSPQAAAHADRLAMVAGFVDAYRRYCLPVGGIDDLRFAPFQILAAEGSVHALTGLAPRPARPARLLRPGQGERRPDREWAGPRAG